MTIFTGTAPTFAAGDNATIVANLNTLRDGLKATSEAWTAYTHGWTGTIGDGTIVAKYRRLNKTVDWRIQLTWGSTTSHAASTQGFNLPVATHADYLINMHVGNGAGLDLSAVATNPFTALWATSTTVFVISGTGGIVSNAVPWTWATGDKLSLYGTYETA